MKWLYSDRLFYQGAWGMKTKGWFGGDLWLSKIPNKVNEIGHKARPSLHLSEKQDQDQTDRTASKQKNLALKIIMARENQGQKKLLIDV